MYVKYGHRPLRERIPRWAWWAAGVLLLVVVVLTLAATRFGRVSAAPGSAATLSVVEGRASVYMTSRNVFGTERKEQLTLASGEDRVLGVGDSVILSDASSSARLALPDGSRIDVHPRTAFRIGSLLMTGESSDARFTLVAGTLTHHVQPPAAANARYEVSTPPAVVSADVPLPDQPTVFTVQVVDEVRTAVSVQAGSVAVASGSGQITVAAGDTYIASSGQPVTGAGDSAGLQAEQESAPFEPGQFGTPFPPEMAAPSLVEVLEGRASWPAAGSGAAVLGDRAVVNRAPPADEPTPTSEPAPAPAPAGRGEPGPPDPADKDKDGNPNDNDNGRGNDKDRHGRGNGRRGSNGRGRGSGG